MRVLPRRPLVALGLAMVLAGATVAPATALADAYPHQSHGNRGAVVRALQHLLRAHGRTIEVTGRFDDATVAAVRAFQTAQGLPVNGHADTATWVRLRVPLTSRSRGQAVVALQVLLNEKRRAGIPVRGVYDRATRRAVASFQRHAGLTVTGSADGLTWRTLLAHLERPSFDSTLCDYSTGNGPANWGTSAAIGQLEAAAARVVDAGHGRVGVGDLGFEHGGDIPGHMSHEQGLDIDLRPMRDDEAQCRWGTTWRLGSYDRAATRELVRAIRATAPGHVRLIYFNDPVLIEEGLTTWYTGHDDHLHVRYCERVHPVALYDC
jgi:peptidoglycan hydrolase-like protein with peptidoglycan-binding domain